MQNEITFCDEVNDLIKAKRYAELKELAASANPADIAEVFEELSREDAVKFYRILPKELAAEAFVEMDSDERKVLVESFSDAELKATMSELYFDDTVDIIEEMPASVVRRIIDSATPGMRKTINELLKYPDDSAGSIMTTEYVGLKAGMSVGDALDFIRRIAVDSETIYTCYVTDSDRRLIGLVTARKLLTSQTDTSIGDIMESNVISVNTLEDREEIALKFGKYNFLALPVVDNENRLVGIITIDDILDVIKTETEEDFAKMAAITPSEKSYLKTSVVSIWKTRIPWLLLLMISATFTGMIISSFESALAAQVILTSFIPMLMDTGGNSGAQSSVTIIRGISLGEIEFSDIFRVIWKEIRVAVLCGVTLSAANFVKIMLVDRYIMGQDIGITVALTVCFTLAVTVLCAKFIGASLPLLAKKIGFDPAVMASPFITTIVDAISLLVYFAFAKALLGL